jgi:peroxiredoxin
LRQDYAKFQAQGIEIIVVGPDGPDAFRDYWRENSLPFIGCADPKSRVASSYHQEVSLFKLGRMPAVLILDPQGRVRYSHYGASMSDIPANAEVLQAAASLK